MSRHFCALLGLSAFVAACQLPTNSPTSSSAAISGCESEGKSNVKNPHCSASPNPGPSAGPGPVASSGPSLQISKIEHAVPSWWTHFEIDGNDNVYLPDVGQNGVLKTAPSGEVTRFFAGLSCAVIAKDSENNIFVFTGAPTSSGGSPAAASIAIRKISPSGTTSTICSSSDCQYAAMMGYWGSGVVDSQGNLYFPYQAWSPGNVYLNSFIAKVSSAGSYSLFAGAFGAASTDGPSTSAVFKTIKSMMIDDIDQLYFQESDRRIKKIASNGIVSTLHEFSDDRASSIIRDANGNFFYLQYDFPDIAGNVIAKLDPSGTETLYCGAGWAGQTEQTGACATTFIWQPSGFGMAFDASGNIVFNQYLNAGGSALFRVSLK